MRNLLDETKAVLEKHNKTLDDVVFICGDDFEITKDDFIKYSNAEYDNGFGGQEVATDLKVVGSDWWLERHEYDGSEWWEYKELPTRPSEVRSIHKLVGGCWSTLKELQERD